MALTKPAGTWRFEDLIGLPDDRRYEMPSPGSDHALTVMNLITALLPVVTSLGTKLLTTPLDVFFPGANPVQPDLLVLTRGRLRLISKRGIEGAPDLVIEVLSPSNPEHDRIRKRALYARGGVPEYWLVSPEAASIEVPVLDGDHDRTYMRAAGDEPVTSALLPGLSFPAAAFA